MPRRAGTARSVTVPALTTYGNWPTHTWLKATTSRLRSCRQSKPRQPRTTFARANDPHRHHGLSPQAPAPEAEGGRAADDAMNRHWLTGWIYHPGTWIDVVLLILAAAMLMVDVAVLLHR